MKLAPEVKTILDELGLDIVNVEQRRGRHPKVTIKVPATGGEFSFPVPRSLRTPRKRHNFASQIRKRIPL